MDRTDTDRNIDGRANIDRIACRKSAWGARLASNWLRLLLVALALLALGLLFARWS